MKESAQKIRAAKYDLGLVKQRLTPIETIDREVGNKETVALANEIAEHAVTLVTDEDKLVPLKNLNPDAKIFNLAVTNGEDRLWISTPFTSKLDKLGVNVQ